MRYDVAALTSVQSNVTGCAGLASFAGLTSDGAAGAGGLTVRITVRVTPLNVAEIVAGVDAVTDVVVIVKFALVPPAGTVTLTGTSPPASRPTATPPLHRSAPRR